ncbi:unnamed protein product [Rotaria sp. Silwood2]|nr:unnamed protein product [Rotaria sp. Silwood2]CAF3172660.1 unnamed protein product [Rotaria sp. Silwood2]
MSSKAYYSNRVNAQRQRRAERRRHANTVPVDTSCSDSDGLENDETGVMTGGVMDNNLRTTGTSYNDLIDYIADEHDNMLNDSNIVDNSSRLYSNSEHSVISATKLVLGFATSSNLDKQSVMKLLKLIKSLLPQPNVLPTSLKSILKAFGRTSSFYTKFICERCGGDTVKSSYGVRKCTNSKCSYHKQNLLNTRVTECVTLDIRTGLHGIMKANAKLFLNRNELTPVGDIVNFRYYYENTNDKKVSGN